MNERQATASRIAGAIIGIILIALAIIGGVFALKQVVDAAEPEPAVTHVIPQVTPACADAAQWYYEHYVALVAESRALAAGEREASPEWLAERIEPAMAGEPGAFDQLQACREAVGQ